MNSLITLYFFYSLYLLITLYFIINSLLSYSWLHFPGIFIFPSVFVFFVLDLLALLNSPCDFHDNESQILKQLNLFDKTNKVTGDLLVGSIYSLITDVDCDNWCSSCHKVAVKLYENQKLKQSIKTAIITNKNKCCNLFKMWDIISYSVAPNTQSELREQIIMEKEENHACKKCKKRCDSII